MRTTSRTHHNMVTKVRPSLNVYASSLLPTAYTSYDHSPCVEPPLTVARRRLEDWSIPHETVKQLGPLLEAWYSNSKLERTLSKWEKNPSASSSASPLIPLQVLTYDVQGWGTRPLEAIELLFKVDSPICVLAEVGELWDSFKIPQFNAFYQRGTNYSEGVMIAIGKHLKATRIESNIENTVIVDVFDLSEKIRIISIYWPPSRRNGVADSSTREERL